MTTSKFIALGKQLLPILPDFVIKGRLMFVYPAKELLRGIYFDSSDFDKNSFYINVFILPLCVPVQHLHFTFGMRLRQSKSDRWSFESENLLSSLSDALRSNALPFLLQAKSLDGFINLSKVFPQNNLHVLQAEAYSLMLIGDFDRASEKLEKLVKQLNVQIPWQREMLDQVQSLRSALLRNPMEAQKQLKFFESENIRHFKLES